MRANRREFGVEIEATPGTAETIVVADLLVRTRDGDAFSQDVDQFDTDEVQGSSSKRPTLTGRKLFDSTISYILRGPASQSIAPAISDLLRSAMFVEDAVENNPIGAITGGPFKDGETITSTSASGTVFRDTATGASELKYTGGTGDFNGELITGGTSGATATASGVKVSNGYRYKPADSDFGGSDTKHHVTAILLLDGFQLTGFGCLSNLQFEFQAGRPATVTQRLLGGKQSHGDQALFKPSSYPEESNAVPRFNLASLKLGSYSPTDIRNMTLNIETDPAIREDAQNAKGILYADYDKAAPLITIDPAFVKKATKDFFQELDDGTTFAMTWKLGGTAGLIWEFFADECQYTSAGFGSERSLATIPLEIRCNGKNNDELIIWQH